MKRFLFIRWFIYLIGLTTLSFGLSLTIQVSHLGPGAWDVLHLGLVEIGGLTVGTWSAIVSLFLVLAVYVMNSSYLSYATFINILFLGPLVDVFLRYPIASADSSFWFQLFIFSSGSVLTGFGIGMYVTARFGAGPRDAFVLCIGDRLKWKLSSVRFLVESSLFLLGVILGGPFFFGTIAFTYISSITFPFVMKLFTRFMEKCEKRMMNAS